MTYFDTIYDVAADQNFLFSTEDARETHVPTVELRKLAARGWLKREAQGVYSVNRYVPTQNAENVSYALAVASAGRDAYLYGESVLGLLRLAPTNDRIIMVATPRRVRRKLPPYVRLTRVTKPQETCTYEGICSQSVAQAIAACKGSVMDDRLREAAESAKAQGYITTKQLRWLNEVMNW